MKTHQCPICGSKRTFLDIIPQGYQYLCTQCGLCALRQFTPQEAAEAWNELVSKFPPIMRLKPGDLIKIRKLPDNFFVIKTDVEKGVIRAGSTYGYSMSYVPEDVEQWPWEIEQKGGSNDI